MNERIKELIEQAGGEFWQRLEYDVLKKDAYITFDPPESLEKFAELIVNECVQAVENVPGRTTEDFDWLIRQTKKYAIQNIKEHFGVEE